MVKRPRVFIFTCQNCGKKYEHLPTQCSCGSFNLKEKLIRNPHTVINFNEHSALRGNHFKSILHR